MTNNTRFEVVCFETNYFKYKLVILNASITPQGKHYLWITRDSFSPWDNNMQQDTVTMDMLICCKTFIEVHGHTPCNVTPYSISEV